MELKVNIKPEDFNTIKLAKETLGVSEELALTLFMELGVGMFFQAARIDQAKDINQWMDIWTYKRGHILSQYASLTTEDKMVALVDKLKQIYL